MTDKLQCFELNVGRSICLHDDLGATRLERAKGVDQLPHHFNYAS